MSSALRICAGGLILALVGCHPTTYTPGRSSFAKAERTKSFPLAWRETEADLAKETAVAAATPPAAPRLAPSTPPSAAPPAAAEAPELAPRVPPVTASAANAMLVASPQPTAYAIIVGVEKYDAQLPPPTGARADAEQFAAVARRTLGIAADHIQLLVDERATKGGIERALEWAKRSVPSGGRIYFYFSGHGAPETSGGTPYIVPHDGDPKYLDATALPLKVVLGKLGESGARDVLAVVDSCFSGAGGRSVLPPGARPLVRVKEEAASGPIALFSASSGGEISGPVPGGSGGLFTKYVIDGLTTGSADANGDGQVSLDELSTWVKPRVAREAMRDNRDQHPSLTIGTRLGGADRFLVAWGLPPR